MDQIQKAYKSYDHYLFFIQQMEICTQYQESAMARACAVLQDASKC